MQSSSQVPPTDEYYITPEDTRDPSFFTGSLGDRLPPLRLAFEGHTSGELSRAPASSWRSFGHQEGEGLSASNGGQDEGVSDTQFTRLPSFKDLCAGLPDDDQAPMRAVDSPRQPNLPANQQLTQPPTSLQPGQWSEVRSAPVNPTVYGAHEHLGSDPSGPSIYAPNIPWGVLASPDAQSTMGEPQPRGPLSETSHGRATQASQQSELIDQDEVEYARKNNSNCSWQFVSRDPNKASIWNSATEQKCGFFLKGYGNHTLAPEAIEDLANEVRDSGQYFPLRFGSFGSRPWIAPIERLAHAVERTYISRSELSEDKIKQIKEETVFLFNRLFEKDCEVAHGLLLMTKTLQMQTPAV